MLLWSTCAGETAKLDCFHLPHCSSAPLSLHQDIFGFFVFDAYVSCLLTTSVIRVRKLHLKAVGFLNFLKFAPYAEIVRPFSGSFLIYSKENLLLRQSLNEII